jgi:hypothetical protein
MTRNPLAALLLSVLAFTSTPAVSGQRGNTVANPDAVTQQDFKKRIDSYLALRAEAARIRDRARAIRAEVKRHSTAPNWDLVKVKVAEPLAELRDRVSEELLRRNSKQALVPLDRDPVPPRYSEKTRRYYENLGSGK